MHPSRLILQMSEADALRSQVLVLEMQMPHLQTQSFYQFCKPV